MSPAITPTEPVAPRRNARATWLLFAALLMVAAAARLYRLDLPGGIWMDEALKGLEGIRAAESHSFQVFYPANNGREGLWINLIGLSESLFGVNAFGLRLPAALVGVLTVACLFFLGQRLFSTRVGLIAAWLCATGFWHLHFSRLAFRAIAVPLALTASLLLLLAALDARRSSRAAAWLAIAAGAAFGLGLHTYIAFRAAPLLVAAALVIELRRRPAEQRAILRVLAISAAAALIVALPLIKYFAVHPQFLFARADLVSVFALPHPVRAFGYSVVHTLPMLNWRGDANWRHNLSGAPEVLWPVGIAFLIGVVLAVRAWWRSGVAARGHILLLAWLGIMILPEMLTAEGIPHAMRALGIAPAAYLLAALGFDWLLALLAPRQWAMGAVLAALVACGAADLYRYFGVWAHDPALVEGDVFSQRATAIGAYLRSLPPQTHVLVVIPTAPLPSYPDRPQPAPDIRVQPVEFANYGGTWPIYVYFHDLLLHAGDQFHRSVLLAPQTCVISVSPALDLEQFLRLRGVPFHAEPHPRFTAYIVE